MYVTGIRIEGLRGAPPELTGLGRVVSLPDAPAACAVADALTLLQAGLHPDQIGRLADVAWAPEALDVLVEDDEVVVRGLHPDAVAASVEDRTVSVDVDLHLDPPMFGRLRHEAIRDPRVVTALGQSPTLSVKVGWLLSRDRTVATPSVLGVRIGQVAFDPTGKERPAWLSPMLKDLGTRFHRTLPAARRAMTERMLAASQSASPERRAQWGALVAALQQPPFELPAVDFVRVGDAVEVAFGPELWRARQYGRRAWDALRWLEGAWLAQPDVLVVEEQVPEAVRAWLNGLPEGDEAPVEQVWVP